MDIVRIEAGRTPEETSPEIVGAKAANLARMARLGLPVPPAFVLPVSFCAQLAAGAPGSTTDLAKGLEEGVAFLETATGQRFGDRRRPLLVSVRSGAARSMPGMLDTVLDVGCTPRAVRGLIRETGDPRFAWDCRRRFLESFAETAMALPPSRFAKLRSELAAEEGVADEADLDSEALERLCARYDGALEDEDLVLAEAAPDQLRAAAAAVFRSWTSARATAYRRMEGLEHLPGTAVTVQAMVFGNRSAASGAGVAFSRDPSTGAARPVIDVLFAAQGEDVVSGRRNPETEAGLERRAPGCAKALRAALQQLETAFGDVQDVEFTLEEGRLWILQTRAAKRTPLAALRFAVDLADEGLISAETARERVKALDLAALVETRLIDPAAEIGRGVPASGGVAVGRAAFDGAAARQLGASGDPVILIRPDISTADIEAFALSAGILTATGGRTAHAALVARQLGKPCVVGCAGLSVDLAARRARLGGVEIAEGDWLSLDADQGIVHPGRAQVASVRPERELARAASLASPAVSG